jgi:hypothetical protein
MSFYQKRRNKYLGLQFDDSILPDNMEIDKIYYLKSVNNTIHNNNDDIIDTFGIF